LAISGNKNVASLLQTDPENMDYAIEHGATRNFEAEKLLEQEEKKAQVQREEDEANPMKVFVFDCCQF